MASAKTFPGKKRKKKKRGGKNEGRHSKSGGLQLMEEGGG